MSSCTITHDQWYRKHSRFCPIATSEQYMTPIPIPIQRNEGAGCLREAVGCILDFQMGGCTPKSTLKTSSMRSSGAAGVSSGGVHLEEQMVRLPRLRPLLRKRDAKLQYSHLAVQEDSKRSVIPVGGLVQPEQEGQAQMMATLHPSLPSYPLSFFSSSHSSRSSPGCSRPRVRQIRNMRSKLRDNSIRKGILGIAVYPTL